MDVLESLFLDSQRSDHADPFQMVLDRAETPPLSEGEEEEEQERESLCAWPVGDLSIGRCCARVPGALGVQFSACATLVSPPR